MPGKSSCLFVLCILVLASFCVESFANSTVQQAAPGPEIFAPGVISGPANEGSPTFSPDGNTLFFTISSSHWSIILESSRIKGHWSVPRIAPFSGEWPDASPAMSPDGSYLIFVSVRPLNHASDDSRQSAGSRAAASHIWRVNRLGSGWSAPVELPASVNFCNAIFRPSVAADGTIYFVAAPDKAKNLSLFRSRFENGAYQNAEPLPFSDGSTKDVDPEVAPDQSFVIFSSRGRWPGESAHEHLF
ncbi:MAG TPA: hypothetical protein VEZ90_19210, partial [Blastocatellia bacterium]|nr:hypothetical protein [Blastocatellia bacterium]